MWKNNFMILLLCGLLLFGGCSVEDEEEENIGSGEDDFSLYLNQADNAIIGTFASGASASMFSVATESQPDFFQLDASGNALSFDIAAERSKKINKVAKIKRRKGKKGKVQGAVWMHDGEAGIFWYLIDANNKAHKLRYKPRKSFKAVNASMFYEDDEIVYLAEDANLYEVDLSADVSADEYNILRSGVVQAVPGNLGDWVLELANGQVVHWEPTSDTDTRLNHLGLYGDDQYNAEEYKFMLPNQDGFLFQSELGGGKRFFRAAWNAQDSTLDVILAGEVVMYTWGSKCDYLPVSGEELLYCADRYLYSLGDSSGDMEAMDFIWAGHGGAISTDHIFTKVSDGYAYHYTQASDTITRLTRIDLSNDTCFHIFYEGSSTPCTAAPLTQLYEIDKLSVSSDDIIRFCGTRLGETQLKAVQIFDVTTDTPRVTETDILSCTEITALE